MSFQCVTFLHFFFALNISIKFPSGWLAGLYSTTFSARRIWAKNLKEELSTWAECKILGSNISNKNVGFCFKTILIIRTQKSFDTKALSLPCVISSNQKTWFIFPSSMNHSDPSFLNILFMKHWELRWLNILDSLADYSHFRVLRQMNMCSSQRSCRKYIIFVKFHVFILADLFTRG